MQNILTAVLKEITSQKERAGEIRGLHLNPFSIRFGDELVYALD